jgi:fatty-acyl-CoA synthase
MNIADWIERWAVSAPEKIAILFEGQEISYREFNVLIKESIHRLHSELGVKPGDRVAYLGQNNPKILILLFACARLGLIFVPLNWRLAPTEHQHMLKDSRASILFVDDPFYDQCEGLKKELPACKFVDVQGGSKPGWEKLTSPSKVSDGDNFIPDIGLESPLLIIYTSGTTGLPKGAVLTQEAIQYNAFNSTIMHDMSSNDLILTILPLFHVGGLNVQTTAGFHAGATVLLHRVFDAELILSAIVNDKSNLTIILPAHMPLLRALPDWDTADFSSLRSVTTGSSAIPDVMIDFWHQRGVPLLQVYGSSETCPIAIHQTVSNVFQTEGAIGFPAMHCDTRIIDSNGSDCDVDVPGEILVRGKNVMSYYWNNEEATSKALKDGWFHSGDIGYADMKGCYHFVDRKNDVIISGG